MKHFILFTLILIASVLDAQTTFVKKYPNGNLDTIWHVKGRDTFLIESYRLNGSLESQSWHGDSTYLFDNQSNIIDKQYYFKKSINSPKFTPNEHFLRDVAYYKRRQQFYPNSNIKQYVNFSGDTLLHFFNYAVNGSILEKVQYRKIKTSIFEWTMETREEKEVTSYDTIQQTKKYWVYDKRGRLETYMQYHLDNIYVESYVFPHELTHRIEYDSTGQKVFEWKLDSNQLKPFKDNGLCLYGLVNLKGDTIVSAQYEGINAVSNKAYNQYFIAHTATHYSILDAFGNAIIPPKWSFLEKLKDCYRSQTDSVLEQTYLRCRTNTGFGVIRLNGQIVLQPIYQGVQYIDKDLFEVKIGGSWGIVDKNGTILVEPKYKYIGTPYEPNLYSVLEFSESKYGSSQSKYGLIRQNGTFVLPIKFSKIESMGNDYFKVKCAEKEHREEQLSGIFHLEKGWVFDTVYHLEDKHDDYFTLENEKTNRAALINRHNMQFILPFQYQSLQMIQMEQFDPNATRGEREDTFYIAKKNNKFGIFDPKNQKWVMPLEYDFLKIWGYEDSLLITLKDGVWAIRNFKGQILGNQSFTNFGDSYFGYFGQIGDSVVFLDRNAFPFTVPILQRRVGLSESLHLLKTLDAKQLVINNLQKIVVPTNQTIVLLNEDEVLVRDTARNLQLLIDSTGKATVFLPQFKMLHLDIAHNAIIVFDTARQKVGAIRRDGSFILPNDFFAIYALDNHEILWAKKEASPMLSGKQYQKDKDSWSQIFQDTIHRLDKGWAMYDKHGRLLTNTLFEYAFEWHDSIGIGQVKGKQGLWHVSGKNLVSPNYDKIWYDDLNNMFHLFETQNADNQLVGFANAQGQLIADGLFKNMSSFNGEYAFVETTQGLGIVSKTGQYLVEPNAHSIQQSVLNLMSIMTRFEDSLRLIHHYGEY